MSKILDRNQLQFVGLTPFSAPSLSLKDTGASSCAPLTVFPGFCDVHVHFREPGFSYKAGVYSESRAAAAGGYTTVCTMPNLDPVPDTLPHLERQLQLIQKDSVIRTVPYGSITEGERGEKISDLESMAEYVVAYSDDGHGVQSDEIMEEAMRRAKALGKKIVAHCEVNSLLYGGYIHDGDYAKAYGHRGISSASEYEQIRRDLGLVARIGVSYHVCHVSTCESVALLREAKRAGLDVSCETAPHYLVMDDSDLQEDGRFKMNPPLRSPRDREALIEGILDGTIEMIATDHAPHSAEEKARGLSGSAFGIVGLETAFAVIYTKLVKNGILSLEKAVDLFCHNPRRRFELPLGEDYSIWDLSAAWTVCPESFLSKGKATPFAGESLDGVCLKTVCDGNVVFEK